MAESFHHCGFAVFSDVHANLSALQACLRDLNTLLQERGLSEGAYQRMILGDVLDAGPSPAAIVNLVQDVASVHIRGNHEDYLWECSQGLHRARYCSGLWRYVPWTLEQLGTEVFLRYYKELRFEWQSPDGRLWLAHASAEKNDIVPSFFSWSNAFNSEDLWYRGPCKVLRIVGHSHLTGIYPQSNGDVWVNAGSVGYPYLAKDASEKYRPYATYVFGERDPAADQVAVCIRRVPYDLSSLVAEYDAADVLNLCAPYSRGVFLQTVLNKSIIFPAFQHAKALGAELLTYDVVLARWLGEHGYEDEIAESLSRGRGNKE